jgi:hypothetical protein
VALYQKKYGSFNGVCKQFSFSVLWDVVNDMNSALTSDVPTFYRLNLTYGKMASVKWLFLHLKNLLIRFLIDKKKISDSQIEFLASIIANNYPTMKLTEFMLFESRFLGGMYEDFYGETSYILAITRSLQQFQKDLSLIYAQVEREKSNRSFSERKPSASWEEYCKEHGFEGKPFPGTGIPVTPMKVSNVIKKASPLTEVEVGVKSAHAVIDNIYKLAKCGVANMRDAFQKRYKCCPEEYLAKYEDNSDKSKN